MEDLEYMPESELEEFLDETGAELRLSTYEAEQMRLRRRRLSVERATGEEARGSNNSGVAGVKRERQQRRP